MDKLLTFQQKQSQETWSGGGAGWESGVSRCKLLYPQMKPGFSHFCPDPGLGEKCPPGLPGAQRLIPGPRVSSEVGKSTCKCFQKHFTARKVTKLGVSHPSCTHAPVKAQIRRLDFSSQNPASSTRKNCQAHHSFKFHACSLPYRKRRVNKRETRSYIYASP